jgi:hypothetical protein
VRLRKPACVLIEGGRGLTAWLFGRLRCDFCGAATLLLRPFQRGLEPYDPLYGATFTSSNVADPASATAPGTPAHDEQNARDDELFAVLMASALLPTPEALGFVLAMLTDRRQR